MLIYGRVGMAGLQSLGGDTERDHVRLHYRDIHMYREGWY
jgi:hypothetical protein